MAPSPGSARASGKAPRPLSLKDMKDLCRAGGNLIQQPDAMSRSAGPRAPCDISLTGGWPRGAAHRRQGNHSVPRAAGPWRRH